MNNRHYIIALALTCVTVIYGVNDNNAPAPCYPIPSKAQVEWQKMETYGFIHFGLNTFNDREWGYGDSKLETFNPTKLDCEQWVRTLANAGFKGVIFTAKHHDGFCLWPTKYTDYSIRNTSYKDGKGDILGELAAACRKYGLKLGVYLSPWDRHQGFYGTPLYVEYFYCQLEELLTQYGDIFEVWFDGANGGDGWYAGAKENRTIDRRTYYDFPRAYRLIAKTQPDAIIFSDGGPGCRWVGNEKGFAFATNWSFLRKDVVYPGYEKYHELQTGHPDGDTWVAAECDVSIRPGWFYHEKEDEKVKSVDQLIDIYYRSVGHNATFLLNFPVDKEGLIHPIDSVNAISFYKRIAREMADNLLTRAKIKASDTRGKNFSVKSLTDNNYETYWSTNDNVVKAELDIVFKHRTKLNRMKLQEYIPLGQRVKSFIVEYKSGNDWLPVKLGEETTTIGYKRLLRFDTIETRALRIRFLDARACLCINELGVYYSPYATENYATKADEIKGLDFNNIASPQPDAILFDLGSKQMVRSFHYLPTKNGIISNYEIYVGETPDNMQLVADGEFSNIRNNPVMQDLFFTPTAGRYVMLKARRMINDGESPKYEKIIIR